MPWPLTGAINCHAQLGHPDKDRAIKGLVVCNVVWLGYMKGMGQRTCARCAGLFSFCGQCSYQAQVPQHPIKT